MPAGASATRRRARGALAGLLPGGALALAARAALAATAWEGAGGAGFVHEPPGPLGPRRAAGGVGGGRQAPGARAAAKAASAKAASAGAAGRRGVGIDGEAAVVGGLRAAHLGVAAAAVAEPGLLDGAVSALWAAYSQADITHNVMFEAHLAVAAFAVWIFFFESLHLWLPRAEQYRLDGRLPVKALHGFGPDALEKAAKPIFAYLVGIALFHYFDLGSLLFGQKPAIFDFEAPSFARVAVEVALGVFLYDLLFYPIHYSLHRLPLPAWRREHRRHHAWARSEAAAHNASETVFHSLADGALQVAVNILVQQLSPWGFKHPLSRALHNVVVTYLLTEAHSGYDLPFMSHRLLPGVFGGAPRHEAHHRRGGVCYHQFFTYIDDALGLGPGSAPPLAAGERAASERPAAAPAAPAAQRHGQGRPLSHDDAGRTGGKQVHPGRRWDDEPGRAASAPRAR